MAFRDRYRLESLRIRAWLRTNIVCDQFLPLDGILLYQAHRATLGPQLATIPGEYSCNGVSTLPLAIEHPGRRHWYYRCSWAQWSHHIEGQDYWNKRFDSAYANLVNFGKRRGKVIIKQGQYKAYHMPLFYRVALWIEWYCVGDKKEIEKLLSTVTHLGKKASQGWGRVAQWQIEYWPADWSVWRGDGKLMRGIPLEDIPERAAPVDLIVYGIRPSYWKHSNQMPLVRPK